MDTYLRIKSLLKTLKSLPKKYEPLKRAFRVMVLSKPRNIRKYYGLLSLEDWWYLVFRTANGRGAYLFIRLLEENIKDKAALSKSIDPLDVAIANLLDPKKDPYIWDFISSCKNCKDADDDKEEDEPPPEEPEPSPEDPDNTEQAEKEIGPLPYPPGGGH